MDEIANTPAPEAPEGGEQLEGTTADEVAQVLNLPTAEAQPEAPETEQGEAEEEQPSEVVPDTPAAEQPPEQPAAPEEPKPAEETAQPEAPNFTIEIEDAQGNKFTVGPDDNLEDVLAEFEPKNNGQVLQLMRELDRLQGEKQNWEAQEAATTAEAEHTKLITSIQEGWNKEITELQGQKRIPVSADGKDNERVQQVYAFMSEENEKRVAAGKPMIQSFEDALDKLELKELREAEKAKSKEAKEEARRKGGLVGGSSAPASSGSPVYHAGTARNASEAIHSLGLL